MCQNGGLWGPEDLVSVKGDEEGKCQEKKKENRIVILRTTETWERI